MFVSTSFKSAEVECVTERYLAPDWGRRLHFSKPDQALLLTTKFMGTINHKGIPVQSSTYPEDWNPDSISAYNNFMTHVIVQNLENEGALCSLPPIQIHISSSIPLPVGQIIRDIIAASEEGQMSSLLHQASLILKGDNNGH